jgi:alpha-glucosidase
MQLSAFFPFYRNHNEIGAIPQEPYRWRSVIDATITAQRVRFALLPYMYALLHQAHTKGSTVMRALAWNFPKDPSLASADQQFFLGEAILVTPVLEQGASSVSGVFPGQLEGTDIYYDWYNLSQIAMPSQKNTTIAAPLGHIPVYLRGGNVLATQQMAMTTTAARLTPWSIIIAVGVSGEAQGSLYLDDGESVVPEFFVTECSLTVQVHGDYVDNNELEMITTLSLSFFPAGPVAISGNVITDATITWNATNNATVIRGVSASLRGALGSSFKITW